MTREDAAAASGISRKLAVVHLDRLVEVGLLRTDERADAVGRGVGRRPKIYQPSDGTTTRYLAEVLLACYGFEPGREGPTGVRLRTCPFHPLVARSPELVCAISHAFISGFLDGLRARSAHAVLRPRVGECCVGVTLSS